MFEDRKILLGCTRLYELSGIVRCRTTKSLECNDSNFKSDPLFNREPMKLEKQRSDIFISTAKPLGVFSLERSIAGALAVPFRALSRKIMTGDI